MAYRNKNTMERLKNGEMLVAKLRPSRVIQFCDDIFGICMLDINANQKWYVHLEGDKILLRRDIVTMEITIAVFLNDWEVVG